MYLTHILLSNVATRVEQFEGREHLVAPVVALVEGVHAGSGGPVFYPLKEIQDSHQSWNGVPITLDHPNVEGANVSANAPDIIAQWAIGNFWNTEVVNGQLRGEAWIDIAKAKSLRPEILDEIHDQLEVSTGLFSDEGNVPGTWNEEEYTAALSNFRPDHIAFLPGTEGACNWEDGCGVRINMKGGDTLNKDAKIEEQVIASAGMEIEGEKKKGLFKRLFETFLSNFKTNELSHDDVRMQLQGMVDAMDIPATTPAVPTFHYVYKVFDDYMVLRQTGPDGEKLFRQEFKVEEDKVELVGNKEEVLEQRTFVSAEASGEEEQTTNEKEDNKTMKCCKELIDALIANGATQYVEEDRVWLDEMPEEQIKKLSPVVNEEDNTDADNTDEDEGNASSDEDATDDDPLTMEEYIEKAPGELKEVLSSGVAMHKKKKETIIESLLANKRNKFTKEQLGEKDLQELENLAELANVPVDYSLNSGKDDISSSEEDKPPKMKTMNWDRAAGKSK